MVLSNDLKEKLDVPIQVLTQAALDYNSTIISALELSEKKWVLAADIDRSNGRMARACRARPDR